MKNKRCKGWHGGTEGDAVIYDKPERAGVLRSGQTRSESGGQRCCALLPVLEEREVCSAEHQNWASPCQGFCKIPFSGYPGKGKTCSALQLCRDLAHGTVRSLVTACGDGLWSQGDTGQDCVSEAELQNQLQGTDSGWGHKHT